MPTYPPAISVPEFQTYLKDASTDPDLLVFFSVIIDIATEYVFTWLDRDFSASAIKTQIFEGNNANDLRLHSAAQTLNSWETVDDQGAVTVQPISDLILFDSGNRVHAKTLRFDRGLEHHITYHQPSSLACPETVRQVVLEFAVQIFQESSQGLGILGESITASRDGSLSDRVKYADLSDRHKELLRMYKRYPV
jgi:hypothetical protein